MLRSVLSSLVGAVSVLLPPLIQSRALELDTPSGTRIVSQWRQTVRFTSWGLRHDWDVMFRTWALYPGPEIVLTREYP